MRNNCTPDSPRVVLFSVCLTRVPGSRLVSSSTSRVAKDGQTLPGNIGLPKVGTWFVVEGVGAVGQLNEGYLLAGFASEGFLGCRRRRDRDILQAETGVYRKLFVATVRREGR